MATFVAQPADHRAGQQRGAGADHQPDAAPPVGEDAGRHFQQRHHRGVGGGHDADRGRVKPISDMNSFSTGTQKITPCSPTASCSGAAAGRAARAALTVTSRATVPGSRSRTPGAGAVEHRALLLGREPPLARQLGGTPVEHVALDHHAPPGAAAARRSPQPARARTSGSAGSSARGQGSGELSPVPGYGSSPSCKRAASTAGEGGDPRRQGIRARFIRRAPSAQLRCVGRRTVTDTGTHRALERSVGCRDLSRLAAVAARRRRGRLRRRVHRCPTPGAGRRRLGRPRARLVPRRRRALRRACSRRRRGAGGTCACTTGRSPNPG